MLKMALLDFIVCYTAVFSVVTQRSFLLLPNAFFKDNRRNIKNTWKGINSGAPAREARAAEHHG